jgi:serine/threonine-protein kinase RsbW
MGTDLKKEKKTRLVVPAEAKYLPRVRDFAEEYGKSHGFTRKIINGLKVSLDEICSNIVLYAYRGAPPGHISIEIEKEDSAVIVHIVDEGIEFDFDSVREPDLEQYVEQRLKGGLGLHLVKSINDEVRYERVGGKNIYTLMKNLES